MAEGKTLWTEIAAGGGVTLDDAQAERLERYLDLLEQGNARMNLTRITDRDVARVQHVGDALTLLPFLPTGAISLADVGSGGGVPGLPLAIVRPDCRVTLIESTRKKAMFLRETAAALALANVTVLDQRAEEAAQSPLRETFDVAVARAVAELVWLTEWCVPLIKVGGRVLAMKGEKAQSELAAATNACRLLGAAAPAVHPVALPGTEHHVVVEMRKISKTDRRYPRRASIAKAKPIA